MHLSFGIILCIGLSIGILFGVIARISGNKQKEADRRKYEKIHNEYNKRMN
jgi:hypothetical protein